MTSAPPPLEGLKVLELAGFGPAPFAAMMLGDFGAEVIRLERHVDAASPLIAGAGPLLRSRTARVALDLKDPAELERARELADCADVLLEGFRPGVMERLGLGPDELLARNPRLVYGRVTGWGRSGPLAMTAGHDINYIAVGGVLHGIAREGEAPLPPLNLVGDYAGGGMLFAFGLLAALAERERSGRGQVVDTAMLDGSVSLMASIFGHMARGDWHAPGTNLIDSGAPFYNVYATADGRHVAVGAIEEKFYDGLLEGLGLTRAELPAQGDRASWPAMRERFAAIFATRTRDEWVAAFADLDACFSPVLDVREAARHPQLAERGVLVAPDGVLQAGAVPALGRTPGVVGRPYEGLPELDAELLARWRAGAPEAAR